MTQPIFYRLDAVSVIDVSGADADTIVHNLTTNEVKSLADGEGCETFVTDVRGKTIGHVFLFREGDSLRMIGPAGQTEAVVAHVDRYTIREDATPQSRDDSFTAFVLPSESAQKVGIAENADTPIATSSLVIDGAEGVAAYVTRWLGEMTIALLVETGLADTVDTWLRDQSFQGESEPAFHHARTLVGFPWYGIDLNETNLPQEADRDALAISFTKGCYLGQETVARLDALGQVQRKLVRWSIAGGVPESGTTLAAEEKTVGRLTSVAADESGGASALGFARRSHFDTGAVAHGQLESTGAEITATVV